MGQMATLLTKRQWPSNSEVNLRREGKEHVKAITLRSGRELVAPGPAPLVIEEETKATY